MKGWTAFSTSSWVRVGSNASGAGSWPAAERIVAACRASTWTIAPAVAALGVGGCGGSEESASTTDDASAHSVEIADFEYAPETLTVPAGTKVTWSN